MQDTATDFRDGSEYYIRIDHQLHPIHLCDAVLMWLSVISRHITHYVAGPAATMAARKAAEDRSLSDCARSPLSPAKELPFIMDLLKKGRH